MFHLIILNNNQKFHTSYIVIERILYPESIFQIKFIYSRKIFLSSAKYWHGNICLIELKSSTIFYSANSYRSVGIFPRGTNMTLHAPWNLNCISRSHAFEIGTRSIDRMFVFLFFVLALRQGFTFRLFFGVVLKPFNAEVVMCLV